MNLNHLFQRRSAKLGTIPAPATLYGRPPQNFIDARNKMMPVTARPLHAIVAVVALLLSCVSTFAQAPAPAPKPTVVVAEGELFKPGAHAKPWKLTPQDDSYAAH